MHIKFLNHGTGDPHRAVEYLLASHDHTGYLRPEVKVLRGNPRQVADLAQSLPFVHRYTSAVIAWHSDDKPTLDEAREVVADFERLAFAGLEPDQFASTAIWHGGHVHVFCARVELRTGKSLNVAPPNGKKAFDNLRDKWNYLKGWARPDDPARARLFQPGSTVQTALSSDRPVPADVLLSAFMVEPELRSNASRKAAIAEWILCRVLIGEIDTREQVISAVAELGQVGRIGDDYISANLLDDQSRVRFKGTLFDSRFDAQQIRATAAVPIPVVGAGREVPNLVAAEAAVKKLEAAFRRRVDYNQKTYVVSAPSPTRDRAGVEKVSEKIANNVGDLKLKDDHDGDRNPFIASAFESFKAARSAVRRLVRACQSAVITFGTIERASHSAERAGHSVERTIESVILAKASQNVLLARRNHRAHQNR